MGLQIRTYVEGQEKYIDLYGNEDIAIEVSFAEIQDITKKNSAYTKEFRVPGSSNNNEVFNYFFDINSAPLDWNPKRKFEAQLIFNGYELYNGNIRLNSVTIVKREKVYSITFYAEVGDLAANIGDKALCNVDTSSLNHSLYDYYTAQSLRLDPSLHPSSLIPSGATYWNYFVNPVANGDVQYILGQRGYDYTGSTFGTILDIDTAQTPVLDFSGLTGFFDNWQTPVIPPYLIPSIRARKLYELIANQADYQIESSFFDTDYFGRYYVPLSFNTDSVYMAQSRNYYFEFFNQSGTTGGMLNGAMINCINAGGGATTSQFVFKPQILIEDNLGFNPVNPANYPFTGLGGVTGPPGLSGGAQNYVFAVPLGYSNDQEIQISFNYSWTGTPDPMGGLTLAASILTWNLNAAQDVPFTPVWMEGYLMNGYNLFVDNTISPEVGTITYTVTLCPFAVFNQTGFYYIGFYDYIGDLNITDLRVKISQRQQCLPFTIELNQEMSCTNKQIEFIQDVNRMFNLVVVPHPIKPKTLIIEPIVDWIGKGELLDWTSKVDYDSPQTLRPTTSIINGSIFTSNKIDKDFVNTQYNSKSNKIFGQQIFDLGVDYKNEFIPLTQQLGQNTDYYLNASGMTNIALPCYFISKETNKNGQAVFEYRPFRSLPRMAFKSVPLPSGNTGQAGGFLRVYDISYQSCGGGGSGAYNPANVYRLVDMPNVNRLTTYPFAISGFSHYTIYDSAAEFTPDELVYPEVDNQYDRYYRDYIEDLTSEDNKIYSCKMYLTPWEVAQLYSNEVIFIKNAKFRINKISNLNLVDPALCDVELVKLTRDYTPTPILFYDLIECGNECNIIHSHTDLNYLLWAFGTANPNATGTTEGKYVELITQFGPGTNKTISRFKVIQTEYNPNYTYENVYFNFTTSNIVVGGSSNGQNYYDFVMYDSCTATTPSYVFDIIDTISATTAPCECVTMNVTNTGATTSTFTFTNCSGTTSSWTLAPSSGVTVCGCYGSFMTTGFTYCPDLSVEICTATPLPTPTPTPGLPTGTPTPTPTVTPTSTQHCVDCYELNITNNNPFECRITYYNCSTAAWVTYDLPGNTGTVIPCGCPDIIGLCADVSVVVGLACN